MTQSVAATQWTVLTFLWQRELARAGRDVDGRIANGLIKRGLVTTEIGKGPRGGKSVWYKLTKAGRKAVEKTLTNPVQAPLKVRPRTHDEDLQGAIEEQLTAIKAAGPIKYVPEPRRHQQLHEFVPRSSGHSRPDLCKRCNQTRENGAHPRKTKRELRQEQRVEMDQIISNAEQDFNSLESNIAEMDFAEVPRTKSQDKRLRTLYDDIQDLLEQWP